MSSIAPFSFGDQELRVVGTPDAPRFVAADVLAILNVDRTALRRLDDDEKGVDSIHTPGGEQEMTTVTESGLYSLVLGSRKVEALRFKKWVTSEVIPSIRKTGSYGTAALSEDEIVHQALQITARKVEALEAKVAEDAPKVEYVDRHVIPEQDAMTFRDASKHLGIREKDLREGLVAAGWIYKHPIGRKWTETGVEEVSEWRAYAAHAGKFCLRAQHNAPRHHNDQVRQTLYIRAAALPTVARKLGTNELEAVA